jgi:hypothetical protein
MFGSEFWSEFISNGAATLFGAIVGIPIALWLSRFQSSIEQRARKSKILTLLEEELLGNMDVLAEWKQNPKDHLVQSLNLWVSIKVKHWNAFSDGGELQWIQNPRLLSEIADAYNRLIVLKELCNQYFLLQPLGSGEQSRVAINAIIELMDRVVLAAIKDSQEAISAINRTEQSLSDLNWYERLTDRNA